MEPMALGSPPSSPSSPGANPNYLPAFLLGENQQNKPAPPSFNVTPGRDRSMSNYKMGLANSPESRNLSQKIFNQSAAEVNLGSPYVTKMEKPGPPKQGLFDTLDKKKVGSPVAKAPMSFNESLNLNDTPIINRSFSDSILKTNGDDTNWITVFGFPPSCLSVILAHFTNCGTIVEKKLPTQGNWVHIKFSSFDDVSKAIGWNGRVITPGVMVGVAAYKPQSNKENLEFSRSSFHLNSPRVRSLRRSVIVPSNLDVSSGQNVPQKSTGLVTKAMEYVFGW